MMTHCPACRTGTLQEFYTIDLIPVHSVRLLWTKEEAVRFPSGQMRLAHCPVCGFICNRAYQPELQDYSAEYELTQAYSPTFNAFAQKLAESLVDRYDLHNKRIIEIGCGQGEFLSLLCEIGDNQGIGFDPAYATERSAVTNPTRVSVIADEYSEKYTSVHADVVVCKMTLEHIRDVADFIATVRRSVGSQSEMRIFFQVPDVMRIFDEVAFWDIYYEHCSYFSQGSLARLFRQQGFDVLDLWRDYGDQYLMIDARPVQATPSPRLPQEMDLDAITNAVPKFHQQVSAALEQWNRIIRLAHQKGQRTVLWGSGSKGVAFLTTLGIVDAVEYTVDINPNKHGTYMAGTGQQVVSPEFMQVYRPDVVVLMNPIYLQEVRANLNSHGLDPQIYCVGGDNDFQSV